MLDQAVNRGDWITATHPKTGAVITGQSTNRIDFGDPSLLTIQLPPPAPGTNTVAQQVTVNVNHWDVEILNANLLGQ